MIEVACATDDRYAPHCATMLRSLLASNEGEVFRVHLLHGPQLQAATLDALRGFLEREGVAVNPLAVPDALIAGFPDRKFHIACWYRVLLPQLLPRTQRVIYLDSDMLVLRRLAPLWRVDLGRHLFGAVVNPLYPFMSDRAAALGLPGPEHYLNSGVMLMDLERIRGEQLTDRLRRYGSEHPDNPWPEQDALSAVCQGQWLQLPPVWNVQTTLFDLPGERLPFQAADIADARTHPAIVHFIGPLKPWHYLCRHPLRRLYAEHRRNTPWPRLELEGRTWKNVLMRPFPLGAQLRLRGLLRTLMPRQASFKP